MKNNNSELWINRIRLELYEETKDLTIEERVIRSNKLAEKLAQEYGFIISPSVRNTDKPIRRE